jgi:hypothetical protein
MQEANLKIPKHEFTMLCDDVRQEVGGKTSIMGLYDHHIVVPQIPCILPKICFYTRFSNLDGLFKFNLSIISPNGEHRVIVCDSDVSIPTGAKEGTFNVAASPFDIIYEGIYEAIICLVKGNDSFEYVYKFAISDSSNTIHGGMEIG